MRALGAHDGEARNASGENLVVSLGGDCLVFVDGELKEGTASGCAFKIVPKAATAAAATATTK